MDKNRSLAILECNRASIPRITASPLSVAFSAIFAPDLLEFLELSVRVVELEVGVYDHRLESSVGLREAFGGLPESYVQHGALVGAWVFWRRLESNKMMRM